MEALPLEASSKHLNLGTFRVYDQEITLPPNKFLRDFLDDLIFLTSKGLRMQRMATDGLENGLYFMLSSKRLQKVELYLNGNSRPNYSFKVVYPKETVQGADFPSVEERIRILKVPLMDFDNEKMEKNLFEEYPLFRFHLSPTDEYDDRLLKALTRSKTNPNAFDYEVKSLVPLES